MKNVFGNQIHFSLFGESHGPAVGIVIDGLAPGIPLDFDFIHAQLGKRKAQGRISTARQEEDDFSIESGYFEGFTTGTPLCLVIQNQKQSSRDYSKTKTLMRPAHADYTAYAKYLGFQDYRGGGHFSGRITAPLVAAGAICQQILKTKGIEIGSHIAQLKDISDVAFAQEEKLLQAEIRALNSKYFPTISTETGTNMIAAIEKAQEEGDSLGGIVETGVIGMPAGIGEPFFDSIESVLAHLLFSIPAVKGVEFGLGFSFAGLYGSQANDAFYYNEQKKVKTKTNHNGGLNGGVTNGMPILIRTCVKPTPSIYKKQETVDIAKQENAVLQITGRHDPAIIHRARAVVDSVVAIGLLDLLTERFGCLWMREKP